MQNVILTVCPLPVSGGMCAVTEAVGRYELSRARQGQVYAAAAPGEDFAQTHPQAMGLAHTCLASRMKGNPMCQRTRGHMRASREVPCVPGA